MIYCIIPVSSSPNLSTLLLLLFFSSLAFLCQQILSDLLPFFIIFIPGEREAVLSRLENLLSSSSPQLGTHFEMASFVDESIVEDLLHYVIPHVRVTEYFK